MTTFIALDAAQAEKLRGVTSSGHALDPIALADGVTFLLPLEVLSDPAHAHVLEAFSLGKIEALAADIAPSKDAADKTAEATYQKLDVSDKGLQREVDASEFKPGLEPDKDVKK